MAERKLYHTQPGDIAYKSRAIAEDPRYARVKELAAQDKYDEAQDLENQIQLDLFGPKDPR